MIQPVTTEQRSRLGGAATLQAALFAAAELPPRGEVEAFADRARTAFAA